MKTALKLTVILTPILCGVYPAAVWCVGQLVFRDQANGSLVHRDGKAVGSTLIGQGFTRPEYFHGRPSAAGEKGYDSAASSGSNLGPTNPKLAERVSADVERLLGENPTLRKGEIPPDLVTTSASGLDPHLSPEAARVQVDRVARARGLPAEQVQALLDRVTEGPQWGLFGEPVVNVLSVNLALDQLK